VLEERTMVGGRMGPATAIVKDTTNPLLAIVTTTGAMAAGGNVSVKQFALKKALLVTEQEKDADRGGVPVTWAKLVYVLNTG